MDTSATTRPPLAVYFIWHPTDAPYVNPLVNHCEKLLTRDSDRPFSRAMNVPLFFCSSLTAVKPPSTNPEPVAEKVIVFPFTSMNTAGVKEWRNYVESLPADQGYAYVPIAVDRLGLRHAGVLEDLNCIRSYEWDEMERNDRMFISIAHEIIRYAFTTVSEPDRGIDRSTMLFLSHAKSETTGLQVATALMKFIENSNMRSFFDTTGISPGYDFTSEIENNIKGSTLIAIHSDIYSSRYWCQREILAAKKNRCPIIAVDCQEEFEDRRFPMSTNVPGVHVDASRPLYTADVLRILRAAILETLRCSYAEKLLDYYRAIGWVDAGAKLTTRPPEIWELLELKQSGVTQVCYPEPPVYGEEKELAGTLGIKAYTPLDWDAGDLPLRVGISISDPPANDFVHTRVPPGNITKLAQDLARHLLARSATLIYGGDLRKEGFTQFILDEAMALKSRTNSTSIHVENHLAWPIHCENPAEVVEREARFSQVISTVQVPISDDVRDFVADASKFLLPVCTENRYVWSRCLTKMRDDSIRCSDARICAGGRCSGYKGLMPGVLEETLIAMDQGKPLYLLGGLGGIMRLVCSVILEETTPEEITKDWQVAHTPGYEELLTFASAHHIVVDYAEILKRLHSVDVEGLASRAGLEKSEYVELMNTEFIDVAIHLALKGMSRIAA